MFWQRFLWFYFVTGVSMSIGAGVRSGQGKEDWLLIVIAMANLGLYVWGRHQQVKSLKSAKNTDRVVSVLGEKGKRD